MKILIDRKCPLDLFRAYEFLTKNNNFSKNIHLLFIGDGKLKPEIKKYVKENNIRNIHFFGFKDQSELPYYYNAMDFFVLPSDKDPSPKVLNEALGFGLYPSLLPKGLVRCLI